MAKLSNETAFRKYVCHGLNKFGHTSKIESHAMTTGFPDINFCIDGVEGNIECKFQYAGYPMDIRPSQKRWFKDRLEAGGNCWLLGCFDVDGGGSFIYLVHGSYINHLTNQRSTWADRSSCSWIDEIDFEGLQEALKCGWQ